MIEQGHPRCPPRSQVLRLEYLYIHYNQEHILGLGEIGTISGPSAAAKTS